MFTCMNPFMKKVETNIHYLPCGKCPYCFKRKVNQWAYRLQEEEKVSTSSYFLTLTFDDDNVPVNDDGLMTLNKEHWQKYLKRVRKEQDKQHEELLNLGIDIEIKPIKYYMCGEYGSKLQRPHYHAIIFNANKDILLKNWINVNTRKPLGSIYFGDTKEGAIKYTLKYMNKIKKDFNDSRLKEFALMSKGLGMSYLTEKMCEWHKKDLENRVYVNKKDGHKIAMPRYYKDKLYNNEERGKIKAFFTEKVRLEHEKADENTPVIMKRRKEAIKQEYKKQKLDYLNRKN